MAKIGEYWNELRKDADEVEEEPQLVPGWEICECCKQSINPDLIRTFDGKKYHKKCFRRNVRMARKAWGF